MDKLVQAKLFNFQIEMLKDLGVVVESLKDKTPTDEYWDREEKVLKKLNKEFEEEDRIMRRIV